MFWIGREEEVDNRECTIFKRFLSQSSSMRMRKNVECLVLYCIPTFSEKMSLVRKIFRFGTWTEV